MRLTGIIRCSLSFRAQINLQIPTRLPVKVMLDFAQCSFPCQSLGFVTSRLRCTRLPWQRANGSSNYQRNRAVTRPVYEQILKYTQNPYIIT